MYIFRTDRGLGFLILYLLLAVVMSAVGTSLTGDVRVPIAASVVFVIIMMARYECGFRLQHSHSVGLKVMYFALSAVLWYGVWLTFSFIHDKEVEYATPPIWWFPFLVLVLGRFWPDSWTLMKKQK